MATASHLEMKRAEVPSCLRLQQPQNTPLFSLLIRHVPIKRPYYENCLNVYITIVMLHLEITTRKSIHLLKLNRFLHNEKVCNLILINQGDK